MSASAAWWPQMGDVQKYNLAKSRWSPATANMAVTTAHQPYLHKHQLHGPVPLPSSSCRHQRPVFVLHLCWLGGGKGEGAEGVGQSQGSVLPVICLLRAPGSQQRTPAHAMRHAMDSPDQHVLTLVPPDYADTCIHNSPEGHVRHADCSQCHIVLLQ
jgi:hypothetical protein